MVKKYKTKEFYVNLMFICLSLGILVVMGIGVFALPHQSFSAEENRALASAPSFSLTALMSGRYFEGISDFYADRIPLREELIKAKASCERVLGKSQNNGVIFSKDGYLIDRCEYDSDKILMDNASEIKAFAQQNSAIPFLVPRSVDVLTESEDARRIIDFLENEGISDGHLIKELRAEASAGAEIYYKTDHHLDSDGAYILYRHIVSTLGYTPYSKDEFIISEVSDAFLGTTYSKSGLTALSADTVTLYRYDGDTSVRIVCEDKGCEIDSLYCFDRLSAKDKYQIFLGGNHGIMHVEAQEPGKPRLLLI